MMQPPKVKTKWRPALALVIYTVLLAVMALPVAIIALFRAVEATSNRMAPAEVTALLVAIALTVVVAYVLTRTITTPINALIARTEAIARGGKAEIQQLNSYGTQEIAVLSQSFLDLAGRLVDRTDYVRSFAMHVSHELKSPLTAIRGAAELLQDDDPDQPMSHSQRQHFLDNIIADSKRLDTLLSRLRELSRAELPDVSGETCLDAVLSGLRGQFPKLRIAADGLTSRTFALPPEPTTIVLSNLADNAAQHGATELNLIATVNAQKLTLIVGDNGRGIAPSNRDKIFRPFSQPVGKRVVRAWVSISFAQCSEPTVALSSSSMLTLAPHSLSRFQSLPGKNEMSVLSTAHGRDVELLKRWMVTDDRSPVIASS